jgi:hypothetical protein
MKAKVKRLLELLEHNTHSLWDTNLQYTTDCIILEDKELKDMVYEEDTEESDFKNHIFNGNELCKLIEELKKEVSQDRDSLSQDRPYIRYKTSVLEQMLEECNEIFLTKYTYKLHQKIFDINEELELREYRREIYNTKPYYLREDRLVYAVEKYLHTSEPKIFETDEELAKWLRSRNVDENNELSDEYIINEAISIGEIKQVKRKDIGSPNTRN